MTNQKMIQEKKVELAKLKEERKEAKNPYTFHSMDQQIAQCQQELTAMERAFDEVVNDSKSEDQPLLFKSDYVLIVMEKAKENLKEALQDIAEGKYAQFSEEGIRQFKSNVERDLADADTALSLLKQYAPQEKEVENESY